jgi:hypothetical protein
MAVRVREGVDKREKPRLDAAERHVVPLVRFLGDDAALRVQPFQGARSLWGKRGPR